MEVVLDGGEILEIDEGSQDLVKTVKDHWLAGEQVKAWNRRKAIAAAIIESLQDKAHEAYDQDGFQIVAHKRNPAKGAKFDHITAFFEEYSSDDKDRLLAAAKAIDPVAIDSGLKGNDPTKWKPTTPLGKRIMAYMTVDVVRKGYIQTEIAAKLAEDHD